jgi:hypothetical protein
MVRLRSQLLPMHLGIRRLAVSRHCGVVSRGGGWGSKRDCRQGRGWGRVRVVVSGQGGLCVAGSMNLGRFGNKSK